MLSDPSITKSAPRLEELSAVFDEQGELYRDLHDYLSFQQLYTAAIREVRTKLEVLNDEFGVNYARNPIHHLESRLKSTKSIIDKLRRRGHEVSIESARAHLNDIAGVRVICSYIDDCYRVADMLLRQNDLHLIEKSDYIAHPNPRGYRSLHLDMQVPIYLSERTETVSVEIQIRTVAMDLWASLEHDMWYKRKGEKQEISEALAEQMIDCADRIAEIDREMQVMFKEITGER